MVYGRWGGFGYFTIHHPPSPDSDIGTLFSFFPSRDPYTFLTHSSLAPFVLSLCLFTNHRNFTMYTFGRYLTFALMTPIIMLLLPFIVIWSLTQAYKLHTRTLNPDYFTTDKEL